MLLLAACLVRGNHICYSRDPCLPRTESVLRRGIYSVKTLKGTLVQPLSNTCPKVICGTSTRPLQIQQAAAVHSNIVSCESHQVSQPCSSLPVWTMLLFIIIRRPSRVLDIHINLINCSYYGHVARQGITLKLATRTQSSFISPLHPTLQCLACGSFGRK